MGFLSVQSIVPPGVVLPFAGSVAPDGWLLCQGQAVSRTTYATLFASLGTAYGTGDGSTTFNLPNTQGYFLRGAGTTGIYSTTRGAVQADDFKSHNHNIIVYDSGGSSTNLPTDYFPNGTLPGTNTTAIQNAGGSETRPANVGVNYIIKV